MTNRSMPNDFPRSERVTRWARRHKSLVTAGVVLLILASVGLLGRLYRHRPRKKTHGNRAASSQRELERRYADG